MSVGPMTIARHTALAREGIYLHVFYKGEDVTHRCLFADDTPESNRAELLKLNEHGAPIIEASGARARETVYGGISIRPGDPF